MPLDSDVKMQIHWLVRSHARLNKAMVEIGKDIQGLQKDVQGIQKDVQSIQQDVHGIRRDINVLKLSAKVTMTSIGTFILILATVRTGFIAPNSFPGSEAAG
ncbi:hypothetical protein TWF696_006193 [Orbilia brochopaga]|uniref:t-SNARE coiled-coil homology domain-containing protein n=1 Tax=Orbilia brochopaga TaxID=3140254 RepID=A0AAV9UVG9_9PEZI